MEPDAIRLECLKLAHRHDRSPNDVVIVAKEYESFVAGKVALVPAKGPKAQKPDNPLA